MKKSFFNRSEMAGKFVFRTFDMVLPDGNGMVLRVRELTPVELRSLADLADLDKDGNPNPKAEGEIEHSLAKLMIMATINEDGSPTFEDGDEDYIEQTFGMGFLADCQKKILQMSGAWRAGSDALGE